MTYLLLSWPPSCRFASSRRSHDVTVQGEWLSHCGPPAPRVEIPLPRPCICQIGGIGSGQNGS
jgi:hypothetical protein